MTNVLTRSTPSTKSVIATYFLSPSAPNSITDAITLATGVANSTISPSTMTEEALPEASP